MSEIEPNPSGTSLDPIINQLITKLKNGDKKDPSPRDVAALVQFLSQDSDTKGKREHWYCSKASSLVREAATYCQVWLVSSQQESEPVVKWKKAHTRILDRCINCVKGMEDALLASQFSYLAGYKREKIARYIQVYAEWNADRILDHLQEMDPRATLDELPPPIFFHIIYNPAILSHAKIWSLAQKSFPQQAVSGWPEPAPPGLIPLLFLSGPPKKFAANQLQKMRLPSEEDQASQDSYYKRTYNGMLMALANSSGDNVRLPESSLFYTIFDGLASTAIWSTVGGVIQRFRGMEHARAEAPDKPVTESWKYSTLCGVIVSHLSRQDQVFPSVIGTFETLLRSWGDTVWLGQPTELPQIALDAIKDNKSFSSVNIVKQGSLPSLLGWIEPFLQSVIRLHTFSEVLRRLFQMFTEELQHERFGISRSTFLAYFFSALTSIHSQAAEKSQDHRKAIVDATAIHMDFIMALTFSKNFATSEWQRARELGRKFLFSLLENDIALVHSNLSTLQSTLENTKGALTPFSSSYTRFWERMRSSLLATDADGYAFFIRIISQSANLVPLHLQQISVVDGRNVNVTPETVRLLKGIKAAIIGIHAAFEDTVLRFVNQSSESTILKFCNRSDVAPYLLFLLCSPIEELSSGAQTLLGEAYNVAGRTECLRTLLENHCHPTVEAMISHLEKFVEVARTYIECVAFAKILVRCYTDVLEVLSSRGSGLLFDEKFKSKNKSAMKALSRLWKSMCQAAGIIIDRTPQWARRYSSNDMVPWMRDAIMFANELIAQRRIFESAIVTAVDSSASISASPSKISSDGAQMMTSFGAILSPLGSWLRLTNQELLDRSYNLLIDLFDAFKETKVVPEDQDLKTVEDTIQRLSTRLEKALKIPDQDSQKNLTTKLSLAQLGTLLRRINGLRGEEDSEVEFISQTFSPRKPTAVQSKPTQPKSKSSKPSATLNFPIISHSTQKSTLRKGSLPSAKTTSVTVSKGSGIVDRMRKDVSSNITRPKLEDDMIQRIIQERKAAKATSSAMSLSSSAGEAESSSSESESDEEEGPSGLAQLSKLQKSPIKVRHHERKSAILLNKPAATSKAIKPQQATKDVQRIRYIPDLTPLHRIILGWDYDHVGPEPLTAGGPLVLKAVPDIFSSHRHYLDIFHPLLVIEAWNSLVKSKEERQEKVQCTVTGKMFADMWVEIDASIEQSVPKGWMLSETDIVLLEHASGKKVLAKVHSTRQTRQGIQSTLRYSSEIPNPDLERAMAIQSHWSLMRVFSLSTIHREYAALMGMGQYDWSEAIFQAQINPPLVPAESAIAKTMNAHHLNRPQARAVLSSLGTKGFSLIQGPPGTGKTSTICGLVGAFISGRRQPTTTIQAGKVPQKPIPRKALVCAPSNAAIDEVAKRLKDGVWNSDGVKTIPKVVRLGADAAINISVKDISLDNLVEERLAKSSSTPSDNLGEVAALRNELARLKEVRQKMQDEMNSSKTISSRLLQLEKELKDLSSQRIQLSSRLTAAQDKNRDASRAVESAKRKTRQDILNEADVICCTLSGAGHDTIEHFDFDLVIIDEAAQAIELSSLIPLKFSFDRCIMVGDPQQLPPTVISQTATKHGYNQSLFVRLQKSLPHHVHLLSIQYRMHPEISRLPSQVFYNGKLEDGPNMAAKMTQPWHKSNSLGVYRFFDVRGVEEQADLGHSQFNTSEVNEALSIYGSLRRDYSNINFDYRIGIVSMYRAQLVKLKEAFTTRYGRDILSRIDFNTVDGFQGQEKDIIILSCVRAGSNISSIGFLSDARRVNVAITRSRCSLYILGHAPTLKRSDPIWAQIVDDAHNRKLLAKSANSILRYDSIAFTSAITDPVSNDLATPTAPKVTTARDSASHGHGSKQDTLGKSRELRSESTGAAKITRDSRNTKPFTTHEEPPAEDRMEIVYDKKQPTKVPTNSSSIGNLGTSSANASSNILSTAPSQARPRPPKPKMPNLFIPKKNAVKRPSDAPYPDPKRKPGGAN